MLGALGFGVYSLITSDSTMEDLIAEATNGAINTAIDASGIKSTIQNALEANAESIATALGMNVQEARSLISNLDIESWEAATLPDDAQVTTTYSTSLDGTSATITLYDDATYATLEAYGQSITLSVPESAQSYLTYLASLT